MHKLSAIPYETVENLPSGTRVYDYTLVEVTTSSFRSNLARFDAAVWGRRELMFYLISEVLNAKYLRHGRKYNMYWFLRYRLE